MNIYKHIDYTLLKPTATLLDICHLCEEAIHKGCASVCVPPEFVKCVHNYFPSLTVCTVVGFPFGYSTTGTKRLEAMEAICNGADEIDMVMNLSLFLDEDYEGVISDIDAVKCAIGEKTLKVIIETGYLTEDEIASATLVVGDSMADYIKTSTGFGPRGASFKDIEIIKAHNESGLKIKASGGIRTLEEMKKYIEMGCERIGASQLP